jgi:hypothetical protein
VTIPVKDLAMNPVEADENYCRTEIFLGRKGQREPWKVESLTSLFRGNGVPPQLGDHPQAYQDTFAVIDANIHDFSGLWGPPRDEALGEVFSYLRRRPDGKSQGFLHDFLWQVMAVVLGTRVLSRAEFEAIMARLEKSCRRFAMGPSSRNYAMALAQLEFGPRDA